MKRNLSFSQKFKLANGLQISLERSRRSLIPRINQMIVQVNNFRKKFENVKRRSSELKRRLRADRVKNRTANSSKRSRRFERSKSFRETSF